MISYSYDAGNRLTGIVDSSSGTITPVFDNLNRLTSETTPQGASLMATTTPAPCPTPPSPLKSGMGLK